MTPPVPAEWLAARAPQLVGRLQSADDEALISSLDGLQASAESVAGLAASLAGKSPVAAWAAAFSLLASAARTGGPELIPALKALGLRATLRPSLREEAAWR